MDCSPTHIETLLIRLELSSFFQSLNKKLHTSGSPLFGLVGTSKNHYAYWKKHVLATCTASTCQNIDEIEKGVISFATNANKCSCN